MKARDCLIRAAVHSLETTPCLLLKCVLWQARRARHKEHKRLLMPAEIVCNSATLYLISAGCEA